MMNTSLRNILFGVALTMLPIHASMAADRMEITVPYAFSVPAGARSAGAFMTLNYPAPEAGEIVPDRLLSVETPVAGKAELHTNIIESNTMMMRAVSTFPLPPTGRLDFSPQGTHIMMMELRQPLVAGDSFPMTLVFEKAGRVDVEVPVRAPGDIPEGAIHPQTVVEDMSENSDSMHAGH